ncbi:hypothetical protein NQZ68_014814 [Dissostichus eleginoides]|nr:hypothetical protein NQZ68_014814 [Dissostichus eleginoides]
MVKPCVQAQGMLGWRSDLSPSVETAYYAPRVLIVQWRSFALPPTLNVLSLLFSARLCAFLFWGRVQEFTLSPEPWIPVRCHGAESAPVSHHLYMPCGGYKTANIFGTCSLNPRTAVLCSLLLGDMSANMKQEESELIDSNEEEGEEGRRQRGEKERKEVQVYGKISRDR